MAEIKVCPKCGSTKVHPDLAVVSILGQPSNHICKDCGFKSLGIVEIDERDLEKFRKQLKSLKK